MKARFVFALAALCASPLVAAPLEPSVTFPPTGPVSSVTVGGQLILLGASKEYDDGVRRLVRSEAALADTDQDGSVSLELEQEASPQSAWIAVDLESGGYAVDGPDESLLTSTPLDGSAVQPASEGSGDELVIEGRWFLHVLLVRPKVGAWVASVTDGGVDDLDGIGDGIVHFPLERLEPLDGSPALDSPTVATGDVLLAVVPETLETLVAPIPNP